MVGAACPRCMQACALHEGRPFVSTTGAVELWHPRCWESRHEPLVDETAMAEQPARRGRRFDRARTGISTRIARVSARTLLGFGGATVLVTLITIAAAHRTGNAQASLAVVQADDDPPLVAVFTSATAKEAEPPVPDLTVRYPIPEIKGTPVDELYPSLLDWMHPVSGTEDLLPERGTAGFGAERRGIMRSECGGGHCGVDLGGPVGRPIVAVADGVVVHIEHSEMGRDGRSGRYVRIEHDDGTLTSYMHLDTIIDGLQVGDHVDGGQQIGTLGATAVMASAPHVHFSLELPNVPGTHGDNVNTTYIDPAPFLVRATVLDRAERHHPIKPAF